MSDRTTCAAEPRRFVGKGRGRNGFTLIELMVAAALVGMVLVAASSLVWQTTAARSRVQRLTGHHAEADAAIAAVASSLRNGFRNPGENEAVLFEGLDEELDLRPADRVRFRSVSERVIRQGEPESDVHEVEFWLEAVEGEAWPSLLRRTDPTRNAEPDGGGVIERVAGPVAGFDVSYFDGTSWVPDWPAYLEAWPEAVRVRVAVPVDVGAGPGDVGGDALRTYQRLVYLPWRAGSGDQTDVAAPEASDASGDEGGGG